MEMLWPKRVARATSFEARHQPARPATAPRVRTEMYCIRYRSVCTCVRRYRYVRTGVMVIADGWSKALVKPSQLPFGPSCASKPDQTPSRRPWSAARCSRTEAQRNNRSKDGRAFDPGRMGARGAHAPDQPRDDPSMRWNRDRLVVRTGCGARPIPSGSPRIMTVFLSSHLSAGLLPASSQPGVRHEEQPPLPGLIHPCGTTE